LRKKGKKRRNLLALELMDLAVEVFTTVSVDALLTLPAVSDMVLTAKERKRKREMGMKVCNGSMKKKEKKRTTRKRKKRKKRKKKKKSRKKVIE